MDSAPRIALFLAAAFSVIPFALSPAQERPGDITTEGMKPSFEIAMEEVRKEHAEIEGLMKGARFHTFTPDAKFQEFLKTYRRSADVVETAQLGFLSDPQQSPDGFMETARQKDAWKKPMNTPLSFIVLLPLRTAQDMVKLNSVRLHGRKLDLEADQLCPVGAPELESTVFGVIEVQLGSISPGSFHYSVSLNAGRYRGSSSAHPPGWEYADVSSRRPGLGGTMGSGCTIVDPATNSVPPREKLPVRKSQFLSEARLDHALEQLQRTKFPLEAAKFFAIIGLEKEDLNRPDSFGWSADRGNDQTYKLTEPPIEHLLEIHLDKTRTNVLDASIFYRDGNRTYTLFDSRGKTVQ